MTNEEWFADFAKRESAHTNVPGQLPTSPRETIDEAIIFAGYGAYQQQLDEETTVEQKVRKLIRDLTDLCLNLHRLNMRETADTFEKIKERVEFVSQNLAGLIDSLPPDLRRVELHCQIVTVWLGSEEILDKLRADLIDIEQASVELRADLSMIGQ